MIYNSYPNFNPIQFLQDFLDIISNPSNVSNNNNNDNDDQVSATSTTPSHSAFIDYLKSSSNEPPPPSPTKKSSTTVVATANKSFTPPTDDEDDTIPVKRSKCEAVGDKVDESISGFFHSVGHFCCYRPKTTIAISLLIAILCAAGMVKLNTENRPEKLWVPQDTQAEQEQEQFLSYFPPTSRFNNVIATSSDDNANVLTKDHLVDVMTMHEAIETGVSTYENEQYTFPDLCTPAGGSCTTYDPTNPICNCLVVSILKMWNYDLSILEADDDVLATLNNYGTKEDLEGVLGAPVFDANGQLVSAEAISISYFLKDRSSVENGNTVDPINEAWEENVFLKTVQGPFANLNLAYLSSRSFNDEFGAEITGDLLYVQVSYIVALLFLGATLGSRICGRGSRWAMSMSTLILIALATVAGKYMKRVYIF